MGNSKRMLTTSTMLFAIFLLYLSVAIADTKGKISGKVVDKKTKEALVSVNVMIEGTTLGGATNLDGDYVILNVPPGTYRIRASIIGYRPITITDVRVFIDQTTNVQFELEDMTIITDEVVVVAEREIVRRDVSTSVSAFSSEDVRALPVTSVTAVTGLQAGVESGLVIRGGAASQSLFLLDGVTMRDPRNNQPISSVPLSSVNEISIERGGFNAEYGQLRSGIVNVVSREGKTSKYEASITLRARKPGPKYDGISPFDPNSMWLKPFLDPDVAWVGTRFGKWDEFTRRQYPQFDGWNEISRRLLADDDPTNDLSPEAAKRLFEWQHRKRENLKDPDYDFDAGFGGIVPLVGEQLGNLRFFLSYRREREMLLIPLTRPDYLAEVFAARFTSNLSQDARLDITGTYGNSYNVAVNGTEQSNSTDYLRSPYAIAGNISQQPFTSASRVFLDSYYSLAKLQNYSFSTQFTYIVNSTSFLETRLEHIYRSYFTEPTRTRSAQKSFEIAPGLFADESPFGWSPQPDVGVDGMLLGGHTSTARDNTKISATTLKANYTVQLNAHNEIRTGLEFVYNDLNIDYGIVNLVFPESNSFVRWDANPVRGSFYLQDKLEYKGFIANLGARLDYSNANVTWPDVDSFDKTYFSSRYNLSVGIPMKEAEAKLVISPRMGISHPITENSKLFFNYGHFRQLPTYEQMLRLARGAAQELKLLGNPDLEMETTIAYELGYDHALFDEYLVQVAAFYRDISNQQENAVYRSADGSITYTKVTNDSYQDVRGFELTLRKNIGTWWAGFANYTYQVASGGRFNKGQIWEDPSEQRRYDRDTRVLYQYRPIPTPYARFNLMVYTPGDFGPELGGLSPLANWNLSILGDWRDGGYVTFNPRNIQSIAQNIQRVDWYNFNLRLSKQIVLGGAKLTLFMDMDNVLNTRRLSLASFYDYNDYLDYFSSLHLPESEAYDNIVGSDEAGVFRNDDVEFVPVVQIGSTTQLNQLTNPSSRAIYYIKPNKSAGIEGSYKYYDTASKSWKDVPADRLNKVLDDKAYIDMPNQTSFNFLSPRSIYFGLTFSFDF